MAEQSTTRALKKARTRQRIIDAAIQEFAEQGFEAASMSGIAKHAGVKKALVQYHFETKLNLWQAAVDTIWQRLPGGDNAEPVNLDTMNREQQASFIRDSLRQVIRFARDNPAWVAIMFREASTPGPRLEWLIERHLRRNFDQGLDFVESAQSNGLLPPGSPLHLLHIISGALTYLLLIAPLTERVTGVNLSTEKSLDTTVDMLLAMLRP